MKGEVGKEARLDTSMPTQADLSCVYMLLFSST